jgi:hypothetical protein
MQLKLIKGKFCQVNFSVVVALSVVIKLNLPYYASRPYSVSISRFILICGIRVLSSFAESAFYPHLRNPLTESASAIPFRIPVPRFIPTLATVFASNMHARKNNNASPCSNWTV